MNTGGWTVARGAGYAPIYGWFSFAPNGATNPVLANVKGPLKRYIESITYSATGVQTIVFKPDFVFPKDVAFFFSTSASALAAVFSASVLSWTPATRTLVVQQHQNTTGVATPAAAANEVRCLLLANNTSGV